MPNDSKVECRCNQRMEALWSYCTDDFFCPRCGKDVTRLTSENRYPDPASGEIWVYPRKVENDEPFAFPLKLEYADRERRIQERDPNIDAAKCDIDSNAYFEQALHIPDLAKKFLVWLTPAQDNLHQTLPDGGVSLRLPRLVGDFGDTGLSLRIGKRPSVDVELIGKGIEAVVESDKTGSNERALKKRFRITSSGKLELTLRISALSAPILIIKPLDAFEWRSIDDADAILGSISFDMAKTLAAETVISPEKPFETTVTLDTTHFSVPGQKAESNQNLFFLGWPRFRISLQLERIDKGGLDINPLTIDEMFLGELRSNEPNRRLINPEDPQARHYKPVIGKMYVRNLGNSAVTLDKPTLRKDHSFDWISVWWSDDLDAGSIKPRTDGKLVLEPLERGEIGVQIDLEHVTQNDLGTMETLVADVVVRNRGEEESFESKVIVSHVQVRTQAPSPLTIDFGNTSSYAAMWNPKDQTTRFTDPIIPVHNLRSPESFPTALFFHEAGPDPYSARYDIGNVAVSEGEKQAKNGKYGALVVDLKRWIGDPTHAKNVIDKDGNPPARYKIRDLIVLYLQRIIKNAESILRRYTITEICVSHPAKFTLQRRKVFHEIIDHLCGVVNRTRVEQLKLRRIEQDIDEANAVAFGSVFDRHTKDILIEMITPEQPDFVVASFDMGGGSLDTALIRFHVREGEIELAQYTTEYLGIGGHPAFGGDNVTLAVMELLKKRIRDVLDHARLPGDQCLKCVPSPTDKDSVDAQRRHNYSVLWEVSEAIKVFQCRHAAQAPTDTESLEFATKIQIRLVHDLLLDPSGAGTLQRDAAVQAAMESLFGLSAIRVESRPAMESLFGLSAIRVESRPVGRPFRPSVVGDGLERPSYQIDQDKFLIGLAEIYDHEIEHDLTHDLTHGPENYTIRQRVEHSVGELKQFAAKHQVKIDFVVFGGAGSRLPLVEQLIKEEIPNAHLVQDRTRTKFRVAEGLARFLNALSSAHSFARSSDYTISEFGYVEPGRGRFISIVPNCVPVKAGSPGHAIIASRSKKPFNLDQLCDEKSRLPIHRQDQGHKQTPHGCFDLSQPPQTAGEVAARGYSRDELRTAHGEIRLAGSEDDMQLVATIDERCIGIWKLLVER